MIANSDGDGNDRRKGQQHGNVPETVVAMINNNCNGNVQWQLQRRWATAMTIATESAVTDMAAANAMARA